MIEQNNKSNRITPENPYDKDGNITASNTEKSVDSQESQGMIQGLIFLAKNVMESFHKKTSQFSSEIDTNQIDFLQKKEHHLLSEPKVTNTLDNFGEILRKASVSVSKLSKSNSPLRSEYYPKSNHSSYKFICKNMNRKLADAVGVKINSEKESDNIVYEQWVQPKNHGLENSPRIIPDYYMGTNMKNKILTIDYHYMILDDIRNMRPLNKIQLDYIEHELNETEKYDIIVELNKVITCYCIAHQD